MSSEEEEYLIDLDEEVIDLTDPNRIKPNMNYNNQVINSQYNNVNPNQNTYQDVNNYTNNPYSNQNINNYTNNPYSNQNINNYSNNLNGQNISGNQYNLNGQYYQSTNSSTGYDQGSQYNLNGQYYQNNSSNNNYNQNYPNDQYGPYNVQKDVVQNDAIRPKKINEEETFGFLVFISFIVAIFANIWLANIHEYTYFFKMVFYLVNFALESIVIIDSIIMYSSYKRISIIIIGVFFPVFYPIKRCFVNGKAKTVYFLVTLLFFITLVMSCKNVYHLAQIEAEKKEEQELYDNLDKIKQQYNQQYYGD